jgi:hypothetical protein
MAQDDLQSMMIRQFSDSSNTPMLVESQSAVPENNASASI